MTIPTLAETIANDLAAKCGDDVGGAIRRTMRLCDSQGAGVQVALTGAAVAIGNFVGALSDGPDEIGPELLDAVWRDLLRPLALTAMGGRGPFLAMLGDMATKAKRIDGDGV